MINKWQELQDKVTTWKRTNLKGATLEGTLNHLIEEVEDLKSNPYDPLSLADCYILLMAVCDEVGFSMDDMYAAVNAKQTINEDREWSSADESGIIRHLKETKF